MQTTNQKSVTKTSAVRVSMAAACLMLLLSSPAWSQTLQQPPLRLGTQTRLPPRMTTEVNMSGPRFGLTMLSPGNVDTLKEKGFEVRPLITQFGWQFEKRVYSNGDGVTALMEWIPLISGLEQGLTLPSLNWLVGIRTSTGTEFGIGPNITPVGVGLVVAGGVTIKSGALNIPLNFAVATSKSGARVSIMTGFNMRR
jgi:hypothetical protein